MSRPRHVLFSAWLGFALAALFFYPLAAALDGDPYYLQWQPWHAGEVGVALLLLGVLFGAAVDATWRMEGRAGTISLFLAALLPLLSLGAGLSRQLPIGDALRTAWDNPLIRFTVPGASAILLAAGFVTRPLILGRWLRRGLVILSPVSLVVVGSLATSAGRAGPPLTLSHPAEAAAAHSTCTPVLALLFDELSFTYLYAGSTVSTEYPQLRQFADSATNYLAVTAPGPVTLTSVPGFLAGRRFTGIRAAGDHLDYEESGTHTRFSASEPDGLFSTARRNGFSPEVAGYYLAYCDLLRDLVDACRSFSFYNPSTLGTAFSPLHPVQTTLILWPRQFPLGLFKNPPFASLQRGLVEETLAFALRPIDAARPVFRFVHFSIPHLPFVYDEQGYNPPFDPLRQVPDDQYVRQLRYVDRLFGRIVTRLRQDRSFDRTTIVVFADHGFRGGGREQDVRHVPFIVKKAGQKTRVDETGTEPGERLLRQLVEESCAAA